MPSPNLTYPIGPDIDPTANVKALHEAGMKRQDDLREAQDKYTLVEIRHLHEDMVTRSEYFREIRELETSRLDAIRQVDQLHQSMAANTQQEAILALERTTQASAETLRSMVENTAKSLAAQTAASMTTIDSRLAALEKQSYENTGKEKVSDPLLEKLIAQIESLKQSESVGAGRSSGMSQLWALIVGGVMMLLGLAAFFSRILG